MNAMDALERARAAWARSQPQYALDLYPDALSRQPDPRLSHGLPAEDGDGPGGEPARVAHASLTAATEWHAPGTEGPTGAPPSSLTNQGEAPDDLA